MAAKRTPEILFFWRQEKKRKICGKSLFAGAAHHETAYYLCSGK